MTQYVEGKVNLSSQMNLSSPRCIKNRSTLVAPAKSPSTSTRPDVQPAVTSAPMICRRAAPTLLRNVRALERTRVGFYSLQL